MSFSLSLSPRLEHKLEMKHQFRMLLGLRCNICLSMWAALFDHVEGVINKEAAEFLVYDLGVCPCCFSAIDKFNLEKQKDILKRFSRFLLNKNLPKGPIPEHLITRVPPGAATGATPLDW
jgi:hypothetical protein